MKDTFKQAKDLWLKGELLKCINILQKSFPADEELNEIASIFNDNEKSFVRGLIERSAYDVARNKVRLRLQDYFKYADDSVYTILYIASNPPQLVQLNYAANDMAKVDSYINNYKNYGRNYNKPGTAQ